MNIAHYAKAVVAAVAAGLTVIQTVVTMSANAHGWVTVVLAILGTISVYAVPNAPIETSTPGPTDAVGDAGRANGK